MMRSSIISAADKFKSGLDSLHDLENAWKEESVNYVSEMNALTDKRLSSPLPLLGGLSAEEANRFQYLEERSNYHYSEREKLIKQVGVLQNEALQQIGKYFAPIVSDNSHENLYAVLELGYMLAGRWREENLDGVNMAKHTPYSERLTFGEGPIFTQFAKALGYRDSSKLYKELSKNPGLSSPVNHEVLQRYECGEQTLDDCIEMAVASCKYEQPQYAANILMTISDKSLRTRALVDVEKTLESNAEVIVSEMETILTQLEQEQVNTNSIQPHL